MLPLLSYIQQQYPFWRFLSRRERMQALHGILPTVNIAVEPIRDSFDGCMDQQPMMLLDTHVSLDSHYTRIHNSRGITTVYDHATRRIGYEPDLELPLVRSRWGALHVLESLVVLT